MRERLAGVRVRSTTSAPWNGRPVATAAAAGMSDQYQFLPTHPPTHPTVEGVADGVQPVHPDPSTRDDGLQGGWVRLGDG